MTTSAALRPTWTDDLIAKKARYLQLRLWNERYDLWQNDVPQHPMDVLQPGVGLWAEGFRVESQEDLGEISDRGSLVRVAGLIDWINKVVRLSTVPSTEEQRFTAAHELGHAVLHRGMELMHRDRPLQGPMPYRNPREVEADKFASNFLIPEKWLRRQMLMCFQAEVFALTDDTAYNLCSSTVDQMLQRYRTSRDLAHALAGACGYAGKNFASLAQVFGVSPTTMAIRLNELGLVAALPVRPRR